MSAVISGAVPAEAAELQHDLSGIDPTPKLAEALEEVVDRVLSGQQARGFGRERLDIQDALARYVDEDECRDMLARLLVCGHSDVLAELQSTLRDQLEATLRRELEGSEIVQDVAARMVEEAREWSDD